MIVFKELELEWKKKNPPYWGSLVAGIAVVWCYGGRRGGGRRRRRKQIVWYSKDSGKAPIELPGATWKPRDIVLGVVRY